MVVDHDPPFEDDLITSREGRGYFIEWSSLRLEV
jgi:hypothetical protein